MEHASRSPRATGPWSSYKTKDLPRIPLWPVRGRRVSVKSFLEMRSLSTILPAISSVPILVERSPSRHKPMVSMLHRPLSVLLSKSICKSK